MEEEIIKVPRETVMSRLELLPGLIRDKETEILAAQDEINTTQYMVDLRKNELMSILCAETEPEEIGKPVKARFKNETQREAELQKRGAEDEIYSGNLKEIAAKTKAVKELQIGLKFLENKFSAARNMAKILKGVEKDE